MIKQVSLTMMSTLLLFTGQATAQLRNPEQIRSVSPPAHKANQPMNVNVPALRQQANQAYISKDYPAFSAALEKLHSARPNNSEYMYQLVLAYALLDEKRSAFNMMLQMQRQGLSYDFDETADAENLRGTELYTYLNDLMKGAGQPVGIAEPVMDLGKEVLVPEAITWDPAREAFLIGTVVHGQILEASPDGTITELIRANDENRFWGIYGLAVDVERNRLWATSAARAQFAGYNAVDKGRSVLLEFQLDSMELLRRYPVPVDGRPHSLGKLSISTGGDIYIADTLFPTVYTKQADAKRLQPFFVSPALVSLRGLDLSADGRYLYLADYEMGVTVIDVVAKTAGPLTVPDTLNMGGIDGLKIWDEHLVIVQNGIKPQRVLRLQLDEGGQSVSNIAPLAVAHDSFDSPNFGTVVGDDFYFFANSHWASSGNSLRPVTIAKTSLNDAADIIDPEAQQLMERYQEAIKNNKVAPVNPAPPKLEKKER